MIGTLIFIRDVRRVSGRMDFPNFQLLAMYWIAPKIDLQIVQWSNAVLVQMRPSMRVATVSQTRRTLDV